MTSASNSVSQDPANDKELSQDQYTILRGTVKESFYLGEFSEVTIEIDGGNRHLTVHLNRSTHYNTSIEVGSKVKAYWDWKHSNVLGS